MHICHVIAGLRGGPEVMLAQLANAQDRSGYRVSIVYSPLRDDIAAFRHLFPRGTVFIPWSVGRDVTFGSDYSAYRELKKILRELRPSIVHLHNAKAGTHGRIAAYLLGIPSIYSPHGLSFLRSDVSWLSRLFYFAAEWISALFGTCLVACSQGEFDAASALPGTKVLINHGLDVDAIRVAAGHSAVKSERGPFRIVVSGRIEKQKDPETVSRLATLSPPEWEWIWIGDGSQRKIVEESGRISITGWLPREQVLGTVWSADTFLQASRWEGMPFSLMEAMALARPCVVSNAPGNRDLVENTVSGYVCSSDEDYLRALQYLAADPVQSALVGAGALKAINEKFSLDAAISKWENLYGAVLNSNGADKSCVPKSRKSHAPAP